MTATRDRYGEVIDDQGPETAPTLPHNPACAAGWLGEDDDGRLVPCLTCRPHLAGRRERHRRLITVPPTGGTP